MTAAAIRALSARVAAKNLVAWTCTLTPTSRSSGRNEGNVASGFSKLDKLVAKANQVFESKQALLVDSNLWSAKTKLKIVQQGAQALEDAAANLMAHQEDESVKKLISDMVGFAEIARKKFDLFSRLRASFADLAGSPISISREVRGCLAFAAFESSPEVLLDHCMHRCHVGFNRITTKQLLLGKRKASQAS